MGKWSRAELEDAFENYQKVALQAGTSGDWNPWADLFTEDATYIEHLFGQFGGREAIRKWICTTMAQYPNREMPVYFREFDTSFDPEITPVRQALRRVIWR